MPTKPEMKKVILKQVFKANYKPKLEHILAKIEKYQDMKDYLISRGKKKNRKAIKEINKRIRKLNLQKQQFHSQGSGIRGDPAPTEEIIFKPDVYTFEGERKPKTGSGDKKRKKQEAYSKKAKKHKQKTGRW